MSFKPHQQQHCVSAGTCAQGRSRQLRFITQITVAHMINTLSQQGRAPDTRRVYCLGVGSPVHGYCGQQRLLLSNQCEQEMVRQAQLSRAGRLDR